jgi:hypothetical protein
MLCVCVTGNVRKAHSAAFLPANPSFDYFCCYSREPLKRHTAAMKAY